MDPAAESTAWVVVTEPVTSVGDKKKKRKPTTSKTFRVDPIVLKKAPKKRKSDKQKQQKLKVLKQLWGSQ